MGLGVIPQEISHFINPRGPTYNLEQFDCSSKKKYGPVETEADMATESLGFLNFVYQASCTQGMCLDTTRVSICFKYYHSLIEIKLPLKLAFLHYNAPSETYIAS